MCKHNENNSCAKEKVKFMFGCLLFVVAVGGVWEILKTQAPLNSVVVVYSRNENVVVDNKRDVIEQTQNVVENEVLKNKDIVEKVVKQEQNENIKSALDDFLGQIKQIKNEIESIDNKEFVLDKIKIEEKKEDKVEEVPFKEGQIEVYDSEKGVVDVIIEENNNEAKKDEVKIEVIDDVKKEIKEEVVEIKNEENGESLKTEEKVVEVIENNEKNIDDKVGELENETVNMMENIIANQ